jgi:peptidoglycan/xylan/chitin deacetylase (PgdA/CDA1 family)
MRPSLQALSRTWAHLPIPRPAAAQILGYHRIDDGEDSLCVSPAAFARQMAMLDEGREHCVPLRLDDLLDRAGGGGAPAWSVVVTFDDGWADNRSHALDVLVEHRIPAIVYLPSQFVGRPGYLARSQVREMLAAGIAIGSHTRTHPDLRACDPAELAAEVRGSKEDLEDSFGREITSFAYPTGHLNPSVREAVAVAGYRSAVSTRRGWAQAGSDPLCLPRNFVEDFDVRTFGAALRGGLNVLRWVESARGVTGAG